MWTFFLNTSINLHRFISIIVKLYDNTNQETTIYYLAVKMFLFGNFKASVELDNDHILKHLMNSALFFKPQSLFYS